MCKIISLETKLLNACFVTHLYKLTEEGKANLTSTTIQTGWKMCFLVWRCIGCSLSWYHGTGLITVPRICEIYTCFRKYYPNLLTYFGKRSKTFLWYFISISCSTEAALGKYLSVTNALFWSNWQLSMHNNHPTDNLGYSWAGVI